MEIVKLRASISKNDFTKAAFQEYLNFKRSAEYGEKYKFDILKLLRKEPK